MAKVFISYSHQDNDKADPLTKRWLDRLRQHLQPLGFQELIEVETDTSLVPGDDWHGEIQAKLQRADAAVLLVSPAFLASAYIRNNELPVLLRQAKERGLKIIPIVLRPCLLAETPFFFPDPKHGTQTFTLTSLQAAGSPDKALIEMTEGEQDRALLKVAQTLYGYGSEQKETVSSPLNPTLDLSHLPAAVPHFLGRAMELALLDQAWANAGKTTVLEMIAPGGMGKTSLTNRWLDLGNLSDSDAQAALKPPLSRTGVRPAVPAFSLPESASPLIAALSCG